MANIRFLILITISICSVLNGFAQVYVNDAGSKEKIFIYRVHQIDEFIARFNNDENSFIRSEYKKYKIPYKTDRTKSIRSLFNYVTGNWTEDQVNSLINKTVNKKNPFFLSFYDREWYAEVTCTFKTTSGVINIPIVLKVITNNVGAKWSIISVNFKSRTSEGTNTKVTKYSNNIQKYLSPTSHNNDFISLKRALSDKDDLSCYFEKSYLLSGQGSNFYHQILENDIEIMHISNVKYFFFQVPEMVLEVEYYNRNELNSGWLISNLIETDEKEKSIIRNKLIGIN